MDALAPIGHANERSYVKGRSDGSQGQRVTWLPQFKILNE